MDPATILILVLSAGVIALLVWFEINSRRNEAQRKQSETQESSELPTLPKKTHGRVLPETGKKKAA